MTSDQQSSLELDLRHSSFKRELILLIYGLFYSFKNSYKQ